ncbi:ABC transporter permease [Halobacillus litoralis]|uniref:ABC transporter permease n=1 Tax=Halobacillus litoralis TaxID=45668 RepID=UPI001CFD33CD|nr:ABC transporter permease [Halobacillus litoralis]
MNIRSLWNYEMRATVRRPAPLFLSIGIPLLFILLIVLSLQAMITEQDQTIQAAVVDEDDTFQTKALINQLSEEERLKQALNLIPMDEKEAREAFQEGRLAGIMTIPRGFTESLMVGENDPIQVMTNREKPLPSAMLQVLLESGSKYISASQSAVNTVYDLHIKTMPDEQRGNNLQQVIVTFTLFALDRNEAFQEERVISGAGIGWEKHGLIAAVFTFVVLFIAFYQAFDGPSMKGAVQMRWQMVDVTFIHQVMIKQLKWWLFALVLLEGSFVLIHQVGEPISWSVSFHLGLVLTALLLSSFAGLLYGLQIPSGLRFLIFTMIGLIGLFSAGAYVPGIYLPEWMAHEWNPFQWSYEVFKAALTNEENRSLFTLAVWGIGLHVFALVAGFRKEKRDAYISIFTSK